MRSLLTLTLLVLAGGPFAECPTCPPGYEWRTFPDDITQVALFQDGRQIGAYHLVEDYYRPFDPGTRQWGERSVPPVVPPRRNFGLAPHKIRAGDHYALNGKEVDRQQVCQVLQGDKDRQIPDDASKVRVTVIGTAAERESVLHDFAGHPALALWKDRLLVAGYEPGYWAVQRQGFAGLGHPTIYVQAPDGTVLHRQDDYQGGAAELAEVLRKLDPNYQPAKDRDRRKVDLSGLVPRLPWSVPVVLLGAGLLLFLFRRKP
jgi:hypothetical protein